MSRALGEARVAIHSSESRLRKKNVAPGSTTKPFR
jgi:hypothetical protein